MGVFTYSIVSIIFATKAAIIHIDIDAAEINKNIPCNMSVVGDVKDVINKLLPLIKETNHKEWMAQIEKWRSTDYKPKDIPGVLRPHQIIGCVADNITDDDIRDVLECLITSGNVSWRFELFDRIPVEFRVRPSWVDDYILELVDRETADNDRVSMMRYNNLVAVCNLAASMAAFRDETYRVETKEDFEKARKRVQDMPYIIQNALVNKLAVFDRTIAVATSDWAVKNFMRPRKEK